MRSTRLLRFQTWKKKKCMKMGFLSKTPWGCRMSETQVSMQKATLWRDLYDPERYEAFALAAQTQRVWGSQQQVFPAQIRLQAKHSLAMFRSKQ